MPAVLTTREYYLSKMKAIVLSFDRNHPMALHMIRQYQSLWPGNPFQFRVPYQESPNNLIKNHAGRIELIHTPRAIKQTVLALVADLPETEWIYWCIDDKYPIYLDVDRIAALYRYTLKINNPKVQGMMFCRCRKLLEDRHLRSESEIAGPVGLQLVERKNYYQFWIHQFMRVSVLRSLFNEFPDREFRAKEMDKFTGQDPGMKVKKYDQCQKMYVTMQNLARFAESTVGGALTRNCYESMIRQGITPPTPVEVKKTELYIN